MTEDNYGRRTSRSAMQACLESADPRGARGGRAVTGERTDRRGHVVRRADRAARAIGLAGSWHHFPTRLRQANVAVRVPAASLRPISPRIEMGFTRHTHIGMCVRGHSLDAEGVPAATVRSRP